jgi:hypothetical protein
MRRNDARRYAGGKKQKRLWNDVKQSHFVLDGNAYLAKGID